MCIYIENDILTFNKKKCMLSATAWMNLEGIIPSVMSITGQALLGFSFMTSKMTSKIVCCVETESNGG